VDVIFNFCFDDELIEQSKRLDNEGKVRKLRMIQSAQMVSMSPEEGKSQNRGTNRRTATRSDCVSLEAAWIPKPAEEATERIRRTKAELWDSAA